jgi:hypothetical protein
VWVIIGVTFPYVRFDPLIMYAWPVLSFECLCLAFADGKIDLEFSPQVKDYIASLGPPGVEDLPLQQISESATAAGNTDSLASISEAAPSRQAQAVPPVTESADALASSQSSAIGHEAPAQAAGEQKPRPRARPSVMGSLAASWGRSIAEAKNTGPAMIVFFCFFPDRVFSRKIPSPNVA